MTMERAQSRRRVPPRNLALLGGLALIVPVVSTGMPARAGSVGPNDQRVAPLQKRTYDLVVAGHRVFLAVTGGMVELLAKGCAGPARGRRRRCKETSYVRSGAVLLPDSANGLAQKGNTILLAQGTWGLAVVDVTPMREVVRKLYGKMPPAPRGMHAAVTIPADQVTPRSVARLSLPGAALSVAWQGKTAYVAMGAMGLALVDMSRPATPKFLTTLSMGGYAWSVAVSGRLGLVATGRKGLVVLDLRRPRAPKVLARLDVGGEAREPSFIGRKKAVVAAGKAGLVLVDLTHPGRPKVLSTLPTEDFGRGVGVSGKLVALAEGQSGALLAKVVSGKLVLLARYRSAKLAVNDAVVRAHRGRVRVFLAHDAGGLVVVSRPRGKGDRLLVETRWPQPAVK